MNMLLGVALQETNLFHAYKRALKRLDNIKIMVKYFGSNNFRKQRQEIGGQSDKRLS